MNSVSTKVSNRSPDSYLLTKDCGTPSDFARSDCRKPAFVLACRSSSLRHFSSSLSRPGNMKPKIGYLDTHPKSEYGKTMRLREDTLDIFYETEFQTVRPFKTQLLKWIDNKQRFAHA